MFAKETLAECKKIEVIGKFFGFLIGDRWYLYDVVKNKIVSDFGDVIYAAGNSRVGMFVTPSAIYAIGDCSEGACGQHSLGELEIPTEVLFDFADGSDTFSAAAVTGIFAAGKSFVFEAGSTFVTGENNGQFCQGPDTGAVRRLNKSEADSFFLDQSGIFRNKGNVFICAFG